MSLKSVHFIFIFISALFCLFLSYWNYTQYVDKGDIIFLAYSILSGVSILFLTYYIQKFAKIIQGLDD